MGKYQQQASKYSSDAESVKSDLEVVRRQAKEVEAELSSTWQSSVDYFTTQFLNKNKVIESKIKEINNEFENVKESLNVKAKEIDDRIEQEELARKKARELEAKRLREENTVMEE